MIKHVAIIPDGNRRWAKAQNENVSYGHEKGCDRLLEIVRKAKSWNIEHITFYLFSTENWSRSEWEIDALFNLLVDYLKKETPNMVNEGIKIGTIGDLSKFPQYVQDEVEKSREATKDQKEIEMVLALNYGARDELNRAIEKMSANGGKDIEHYLDTYPRPDPDLLIRTSGEKRLSNYLLYQCSYTELYFTDTLWPDFNANRFSEAIQEYETRERRRGE